MSTITPDQLSRYNGLNGMPVYLSVKGQVYDVTSGAAFYGPEGPYSVFAGRECARALALMKINEEECNGNLDGLDEKQLAVLNSWITKFASKYPVVATLAAS